MENPEVHIVTLPPMRVASFHAFSTTPETDALHKVVTWAKANDYWQDPPRTRVFGFNNPDPSVGSPNYGYEFWITIGPEVQPGGDMQIKDFSGGLYAVLLCDVTHADPYEVIPSTWQKLVKWRESGHYRHGNHQWLEEHLTRFTPDGQGFILDLYLPISE